jgi:GTP cyclohydrolase IA
MPDIDTSVTKPTKKQINSESLRQAVHQLLISIGEDPNREGLVETPDRVARAYTELLDGFYGPDPDAVLDKVFSSPANDLILVKDIEFESICEHHLLQFTGVVHIGYIPNGYITGLSKLVRLVNNYSHRLQVQEQLTSQLAEALINPGRKLKALGATVVIESNHSCMAVRGVRRPNATTITYAMRGVLETDPQRRAEALELILQGRTRI